MSNTLKLWDSCWKTNSTRWHLSQLNPALQKWGSKWTNNDTSKSILFPLCGKSLDMLFFAKLGHKVTGIEGIKLALDEFSAEHKAPLTTVTSDVAPFDKYTLNGEVTGNNDVDLYLGDFFSWPTDKSAPKFDLVFDRGSLVAINPTLRDAYIQRLYASLNPGAKWMIASIEYDQSLMSGPPNSLGEQDVRALLATLKENIPSVEYDIEIWDKVDALEDKSSSRFLVENGGPLPNFIDWIIVVNKP